MSAPLMNRRGFFKLLGLAAPVAVVAPKYFFAPIGGWQSVSYNATFAMGPPPQELMRVYYEKRFLANLKAETPFLCIAKPVILPGTNLKLVTFEYVPLVATL
jgi:hypothetical protein